MAREDVGTIPILLEDQRPHDPPYHPLRESLWRIAAGQAEYSGVAESATCFTWQPPHYKEYHLGVSDLSRIQVIKLGWADDVLI